MRTFAQNEPLTETELDRLDEFLRSYKGGKAMNIEEVDGFFSALIAGPEIVTPSEYMPELFGSETSETRAFSTLAQANEILGLLMRHWNNIAGTLLEGKAYLPVLLEDENGVEHGNDWARGFIRGTHLRHDGWAELLADDDHGGCMIPVLMLYHEHDENPAMRPKTIGPEQREKVIASMAAGLVAAYRHFRQYEEPNANTRAPEPPHTTSKIGRNDPCPCGSGKKYKLCCGGATIQ
ncbi:MAG: UPF0149 family protein [Candidatus Acidiferrales bacterium]